MTDDEMSGGLSDTGRTLTSAALEGKEDPHPTEEEVAIAKLEEVHLEDLASLHFNDVEPVPDPAIMGQPEEPTGEIVTEESE